MKKILLVDDEAIIRKLARNTLGTHDYEIVEAGDGEEAIRIASEYRPDLVLLDIRMPGRSGFDVARAIKQNPQTAGTQIIMLTAELLEEDVYEGLQAGAIDFFTKPFSPLELMKKIEGYLGASSSPARSSSVAVPPSVPALPPRQGVAATCEPRLEDELSTMNLEQLLLYATDIGKIFHEEQLRTRELRAAYEKLQNLEKMKDVFVSLVSHELRTPLSVIKGYVNLMNEVVREDLAEDLADFLDPILQASDRLERLIQELLDFSKMKSGLLAFEKRELNVPAMLSALVQEVQDRAREKGQSVTLDVRNDFRPLRADYERLREAILHVVQNAITFTPENGALRLECEDEGLWVRIRVKDNGPGIPAEEQDRIFAPFYQVAPFLTRKVDGLGLGLSIARHIVDDHGGELSVESAVGKGSTFTISLPRSYQDAREMLAEYQAGRPSRLQDLSRNLQATEKQLLGYAQGLSAQLAEERMKNRQLVDTVLGMEQTYLETIAALAHAIDERDAYNLGHTDRVAHYARCIARVMNPKLLEQRDFKYSLLLHDLGKIGVAEDLLKKAGRLSDAEWETVKSHSEIGEKLLGQVRFLAPALASVRSHHERWDGKGYPDGLEGEEIPLPARIIAISDAFEAMTSDRPYRASLTFEEARQEILAQAGKQFDPRVVEAFAEAWPMITRLQEPETAEAPGPTA